MPTFQWKGIDATGNHHNGHLFCASEESLKKTLFDQGIALLSHKKITETKSFKKLSLFKRKTFSLKKQALFFENLSISFGSGLPVTQSLKLIKNHFSDKKTTSQIIEEIKKGSPLSSAIEKQKICSNLIIQIIKSGEKAGNLKKSLEEIAQYLTQKQAVRQKIKNAATQPAIIFLFSIGIIISIFLFIIPELEPFFTKTEKPALFTIAHFLQQDINRLFIATTILFIFLGLKLLQNIQGLKKYQDLLSLYIPVVREIVIKSNILIFTKTLLLLIKSGNPLVISIESASNTCPNFFIKEQMKNIAKNISTGQSIKTALTVQKFFIKLPEAFVDTMSLGEEIGNIEILLEKHSKLLENNVSNKITILTSLLQPLMLILVGIFIAWILLQLYLPIFDISNLTL